MRTGIVLLVLLAASFAAPHANAQLPVYSDIVLTATPPTAPINYTGSVEVPVQVTVGCALVLQNLDPAKQSAPLSVHADATPTGLTVEETTLAIPAQACVTGMGDADASGSVKFTVDASSPGVVDQNVTLLAHFKAEDPHGAFLVPFTVAYHSSYSVTPDVGFPLKVVNGTVTFHVTVAQNSNARSMVMFEDVKQTGGTISGLASVPYNVPETKRFTITYKAPTSCWAEEKVSFTNFGHYLLLDQRAGTYQDPRSVTWTFTNGTECTPGGPASKTSPLPLPFLALGLAMLVAARRRAA